MKIARTLATEKFRLTRSLIGPVRTAEAAGAPVATVVEGVEGKLGVRAGPMDGRGAWRPVDWGAVNLTYKCQKNNYNTRGAEHAWRR